MSKQPTRKEVAAYKARIAALSAHLINSQNRDPESLARSYGLPVADVERLIQSKEASNA